MRASDFVAEYSARGRVGTSGPIKLGNLYKDSFPVIKTPISHLYEVRIDNNSPAYPEYYFYNKDTGACVGQFALDAQSDAADDAAGVVKPGVMIVQPHITLAPEVQGKGLGLLIYRTFLSDGNRVFATYGHSKGAGALWNRVATGDIVSVLYSADTKQVVDPDSKESQFAVRLLGHKNKFKVIAEDSDIWAEVSEGDEKVIEAAYPGNIGAMEMAKFFMSASPEQKDMMKKLIQLGKIKRALGLLQRVTGVKLQGKEYEIAEGWKDWVAGSAMALGAMGAQAGNISTQIVDPGDTVYKIARDNGVHPSVIMKLNGFNNQTRLTPGQEVKVPDVYKASPATKAPAAKPAAKAQPKSAKTAVKVAPITASKAEQILLNTAVKSGITGVELAAFMAQMAHESHDFKSMVEYGGSLDFRKYDPKYAPKKAKRLGNKYIGDGAKYKGRGFVQITGRYNYGIASKAIGVDLVKNPALAENPAIAAKIAVWYWKHRVQPNVTNFSDVEAVTKPINPGLRGLEDRKENFADYMTAMATVGKAES